VDLILTKSGEPDVNLRMNLSRIDAHKTPYWLKICRNIENFRGRISKIGGKEGIIPAREPP